MFATHFSQCGVAFRRGAKPVAALPIRAAQLGKRIKDAKTDPQPVGVWLDRWWLDKIVRI